MSEFSGKCDLCDSLWMRGNTPEEVEDIIKNSNFYIDVNGRSMELKIDTLLDAAHYYPFLTSMQVSSNNHTSYYLCADSFIDTEEKERLENTLEHGIRYYKKCKRNKEEFSIDKAVKQMSFGNSKSVMALAKRIKDHGTKATIEGIHTNIHEYYRKKWYNELISLGEDENRAFMWVYKTFFCSPQIKKERLSGGEL